MVALEVVCENGVCRLVDAPNAVETATNAVSGALMEGMRLAEGCMDADQFIAFLQGGAPVAGWEWSWAALPLAIAAGFAMNLTPCVLPMIPINLMVIGRSATKGAWYGLGMMLAFGAIGTLAAVGGVAFGSIQGSIWFNLAVMLVFVALGLVMCGVGRIDFSRYRSRIHGGAFVMGMVSALLAGACVAPLLAAMLVLTAREVAAGNSLALALPFATGFGMALPWPFAGAGLKVLPRPGAWMRHVNRVFAALVFCFAAWYGYLAFASLGASETEDGIAPRELPAVIAESRRPVLVDCGASWCKNCAAMDRLMARDERVRRELKRFSVIRVKAEDIGELRQQPGFGGVHGLPAFAIFE